VLWPIYTYDGDETRVGVVGINWPLNSLSTRFWYVGYITFQKIGCVSSEVY